MPLEGIIEQGVEEIRIVAIFLEFPHGGGEVPEEGGILEIRHDLRPHFGGRVVDRAGLGVAEKQRHRPFEAFLIEAFVA